MYRLATGLSNNAQEVRTINTQTVVNTNTVNTAVSVETGY